MRTDSLIYNTATHIAELVSPTEIVNADGVIVSSSGNYNTNTGIADLFERSTVRTRRGNTLTGDTLFYDRVKQYGEARGNMILTDSARQSALATMGTMTRCATVLCDRSCAGQGVFTRRYTISAW